MAAGQEGGALFDRLKPGQGVVEEAVDGGHGDQGGEGAVGVGPVGVRVARACVGGDLAGGVGGCCGGGGGLCRVGFRLRARLGLQHGRAPDAVHVCGVGAVRCYCGRDVGERRAFR